MKHYILFITFFLLTASFSFAQEGINYDESKVPYFVLPDPLTFNDGTKVTTVKQWENRRRAELLDMFSSQMYGRTSKDKIKVKYETLSENPNFMNRKATAKQIKFIFSNGEKRHEAVLLLILPNQTKGKVPVFVGYNFKGNHSVTSDPSILLPSVFTMPQVPDYWRWTEGDQKRGCEASCWSLDKIIERGYGVATMSYQDIYPDIEGIGKAHSIVALFAGYNPDRVESGEWQAIGAWAWGLSRIADYLGTQKRVDMNEMIIMGHSRLGKAALWAGAQDNRFKIVISNDSGCGGAALSKRVFGETIARITSAFPHWFCTAFKQYAGNEANLPFDQHELIALMAPRPVYICSALEDRWADPKGEFLAGYYAGPVYELYGLKGLGTNVQPPVHQPIMNDIGYHIREGIHDVTEYDWMQWLNFADIHFEIKK
jgi:hypothetical protein